MQTGEIFCRWEPHLNMQPYVQPLLPLNDQFVKFVRNTYYEYNGNLSATRRYLLACLDYEKGCEPLTADTYRMWDVRPIIIDRMLSSVWNEIKYLEGYRILTEKVALTLHSNGTGVHLKRYSQYIDRRKSNDFKVLRSAVRLVRPEQVMVNNIQRIIYHLVAFSKKQYEVTILPVSPEDHDTDHMWLYKPVN